MNGHCDFEPAPGSSTVLFDVGRRLRLDLGRWSPESRAAGGTITAHLHYDPQIAAGRTTMAPDDEFIRLQRLLGAEPVRAVPFISPDSRQLMDFGCNIDRNEGEVALVCASGDAADDVLASAVHHMVRLIEMSVPEHLRPHARNLAAQAFVALPLMPIWHEQYGDQWSCTRVSAYLPRCMAVLLGLADGDEAGGQGELVRISSRAF